MLSKKYAEPVRNILVLVLIGVFSFFVVTSWLPDRGFIKDSLESVEESSNTVMKFSAATLSTSLAISALPDDFVLAPGGISHSGPGGNRQLWPDENSQS